MENLARRRVGRLAATLDHAFAGFAGNRRLALAVALATGILIAALGQAVTTRSLPDHLSWLALFSDRLSGIYGNAEGVSAAMLLLVSGAIVFALGSRLGAAGGDDNIALDPPTLQLRMRTGRDRLAAAAFVMGGIVFAAVVTRLLAGHYSHLLGLGVFVSLVLLAVPFARQSGGRLAGLFPRAPWPAAGEVVFLGLVVAGFMALNIQDLTDWRYSAVGDEYGNYSYAKAIADGAPFNPFSQEGVGEIQPVLSSVGQAVFLKLFGGDIFAWKLHLVVVAAASFVPLYLLVRELFSQRAAMFATALFASSHYLFGYVHHPVYVDALLPSLLALWLLAVGLRRQNTLALYGAGAAAGLGFYTFYGGRAAIVILGVCLLVLGRRGVRPATILPIAISFAVVVGPLFAVSRWGVIDAMLHESAVSYSAEIVGSRLSRFKDNVILSFMAFNYSGDGRHYVYGSLLDPLSAVLYVLGLGLALSRIRQPAYRLLLVWWAIALAAMGFSNPYPMVAITRLHYVLPAAAVLAALAFEQVLKVLDGLWRQPAGRTCFAGFALTLLLVPVLYLNLHRFWWETPHEYGSPTGETAVVRAFFSDECQNDPRRATVIALNPGALLAHIFEAYRLGERTPLLIPFEDTPAIFTPDGVADARVEGGCIIVQPHHERQDIQKTLLARLQVLYPEREFKTVSDLSGKRQALLVH